MNRTKQGRFQKGATGNPKGRPAEYPAFRAWARAKLADGGQDEIAWMATQRKDLRAKGFSLRLLAEYGYGKPVQSIDISGEVSHVTRVEDIAPDGRRIVRTVEPAAVGISGIH